MSTDFNKNAVSLLGGIMPSTINTPGDIRCRVETEVDIYDIPNPYVGMIVYVVDTGKRFEVLTLKDKKLGLATVKNALVDTYRECKVDLSHLAEKSELHSHGNKQLLDNITEADISKWNAKSEFSGSYKDLSDLPFIPAKVSDLTNDLSLATESFVKDSIAAIDLSIYRHWQCWSVSCHAPSVLR